MIFVKPFFFSLSLAFIYYIFLFMQHTTAATTPTAQQRQTKTQWHYPERSHQKHTRGHSHERHFDPTSGHKKKIQKKPQTKKIGFFSFR